MKKKLFIFDMDGTLVDSSRTIANSINHVRKNLNLDSMEQSVIIEKINDTTINPAEYFYGHTDFEPEHEKWFSEYYSQNHEKEIRVYDGIYEMLIELKARGAKLAVATNAYRVSALESLGYLNLRELFDVIVCADDVRKAKPYPDMLYHTLTKLDITNTESIFIGDGPRDEDAAEAAYMDYIMVDWGFTEHAIDMKVISDTSELKKVLLDCIE